MGALGRYVDGLLQTLEDSRDGLSDRMLEAGAPGAEQYFAEIYEREASRLQETIREQEPHLSDRALETLSGEVDIYLRKVVIPAYARVAIRYTPRERNDFYLVPEKLHGMERVGWGLAGILVGLFAVLVPFIPLWATEWILLFMIIGLFYPNIRRFLATRRYERDLNQIVARADRSFERIDVAYLRSGEAIPELEELARAKDENELEARRKQLAKQTEKER